METRNEIEISPTSAMPQCANEGFRQYKRQRERDREAEYK
jgi:hypothetical protein